MDTPIRSRRPIFQVALVLGTMVLLASTATVSAKRPPKPPPTPAPTPTATVPASVAITVQIAPSGTLEPSGEYANVDVTVSCPVGWAWSSGSLYLLHTDRTGGAGSFTATCTGTPQVGRARVVNGNRFTLGSWNGEAYVRIVQNGHEVMASSKSTVRLEPGVTARIADQGQLTGTAGGGVSIAIAVACPIGAAGAQSTVAVSQGTAAGGTSFTPTCDRFSHTLVLPIAASQGTFQTGTATAAASVNVTWNGGSYAGADNRSVTLLESSTGDTTPPTAPSNLNAQTFGDTETWLDWGASTDNATPTGLIGYEVWLNDRFDQGIGGGYTTAILYADAGVLNEIEVFAVDGAGNRSTPATVLVDMR